MANSIADLEKLFTELVMGATSDGTRSRRYWDHSYLCIDVEIRPEGNLCGHIIKIRMLDDAIDTYCRHNPAQRLAANARLTRYVYKHFGAFFGGPRSRSTKFPPHNRVDHHE